MFSPNATEFLPLLKGWGLKISDCVMMSKITSHIFDYTAQIGTH
jgi:hypothetical protein